MLIFKNIKESKNKILVIGIILFVIGLLASLTNPTFGSVYHYSQQIQKLSISNKMSNNILPKDNLPKNPARKKLKYKKLKYKNLQYNFGINYPEGWKIDESGILSSIVIFFSPNIDKDNNMPFSSNINVVSDNLRGMKFEDYVILSKNELIKSLQNYKLIEEKKVTLNNGTIGYIIGGTFTSEDGYNVRNLQLFVEKNGLVFIVTGTALESKWDKYKDIIETSLKSFRFLK